MTARVISRALSRVCEDSGVWLRCFPLRDMLQRGLSCSGACGAGQVQQLQVEGFGDVGRFNSAEMVARLSSTMACGENIARF